MDESHPIRRLAAAINGAMQAVGQLGSVCHSIDAHPEDDELRRQLLERVASRSAEYYRVLAELGDGASEWTLGLQRGSEDVYISHIRPAEPRPIPTDRAN